MRERLYVAKLFALSAFVLLAMGLALASFVALARADDGLDLARGAAHECGLDCSADEVAAIYAVATRVPRRAPMRAQMRRFFSGATSRPYYLHLERAAARPRDWPGPWAAERWGALLAVADAVVRGELVHRCSVPPAHWGGRVDRRRARAMRFVRVDCGQTANDFYVPGR